MLTAVGDNFTPSNTSDDQKAFATFTDGQVALWAWRNQHVGGTGTGYSVNWLSQIGFLLEAGGPVRHAIDLTLEDRELGADSRDVDGHGQVLNAS